MYTGLDTCMHVIMNVCACRQHQNPIGFVVYQISAFTWIYDNNNTLHMQINK